MVLSATDYFDPKKREKSMFSSMKDGALLVSELIEQNFLGQ